MAYKGETCLKCGSVDTYLVTTTPRDRNSNPIPDKHRWICNNCDEYFLVDS